MSFFNSKSVMICPFLLLHLIIPLIDGSRWHLIEMVDGDGQGIVQYSYRSSHDTAIHIITLGPSPSYSTGNVSEETEPPSLEESLILVGGEGTNGSVEVLGNPDCSSLSSSLSSYDNYAHSSFVTPDDILMTCGRYRLSKSCFSYKNNSWEPHSTLLEEREHSPPVSLPMGVFLIGGTGVSSSDTTEFLPKGSSTWTTGPVPPNGAFGSCAVAIGDTQFLLIGGDPFEKPDQVIHYNTGTQSWTNWPRLTQGRLGCACVRAGNSIIVAGGYNKGTLLTSTEVIDVISKSSRVVGHMKYPRAYFAMANVNFNPKVVLALGGETEEWPEPSTTVEEWNDDDETWSLASITLSPGRSSFAAVVLPSVTACSP